MATTMHWRPKTSAPARDELGIVDGGGVDRDLVGAGGEQLAHVVDGADAAADGERDEDLVGGPLDDVDHRAPAVGGGGDVEEDELVGALGVVEGGQLDRIAGVAQIDELDALDDPAVGHVEAGDDPPGQTWSAIAVRRSAARSSDASVWRVRRSPRARSTRPS